VHPQGEWILKFDDSFTSSARLAIVACLVPGEALSFTELKRRTGLADGNMHVQCKKLEECGYLEVLRGQRGRRTLTRFRITDRGLAALKLHVRKLQAIVESETGVIAPSPRVQGSGDESQVWSD